MNQGSDKKCNEENSIFDHFGLIFYCYILILVNELAPKWQHINKLKNEKNENIVKTMVSVGKSQKGGSDFSYRRNDSGKMVFPAVLN